MLPGNDPVFLPGNDPVFLTLYKSTQMRYNVKWIFPCVRGRQCPACWPRLRHGEEGVDLDGQQTSLFRQKNNWPLTAVSVVVSVVLAPMMGSLILLPQVIAIVPVVLLALLSYVGPVSTAACGAVLVATGGTLYGMWGALCTLLLFAPTVIAAVVTAQRGQPFWESVIAGCVAMFASMGAAVGIVSLLAGTDVVTAFTAMLGDIFKAYPGFGDALIQIMEVFGMLTQQGEEMLSGLDAAARGELISELLAAMDFVLRLEIPMRMATGAVTAGLLGQVVLRKGMLRRGMHVAYPHLITWHVPKGWGRILGGTLAALYVLAKLLPASMSTMYYVFSGVFQQVFALQGVAALCSVLERRGKSAMWQRAVFVLGYFVLSTLAMLLGIFDQAMDVTHRREALDKEENPFDPRQGA